VKAVALAPIGLPVMTVAKAFQPGQTTVNLIINAPLGQQAHADQTAMR
jgi:hypothetical protein